MASMQSPALQSLVQARTAALENAAFYPQVLPPMLGLVAESPTLELKRWVSDFIAEALASQVLPAEDKQNIALSVLSVLKSFLESPEKDAQVLKSSIQASASAYPLVFRYM